MTTIPPPWQERQFRQSCSFPSEQDIEAARASLSRAEKICANFGLRLPVVSCVHDEMTIDIPESWTAEQASSFREALSMNAILLMVDRQNYGTIYREFLDPEAT